MQLPDMEITLNGVTYDNSFQSDVSIDRTNLDEEFATQAEKYAFYAFLAEEAKFIAARKKAHMDNVYAQLDHEKRTVAQNLKQQNPKFKFTETMCENEVKTDDRYQQAHLDYLKATKLAGQLDVAKRAIAMRRDMLIQMGASARIGVAPNQVLNALEENAKQQIAKGNR